jgi:hypothetical protein
MMTSFAFIAGLIPLVRAEGAAELSRRAVGTAVAGGMLAAAVIGIFVIPALYVVFQSLRERVKRRPHSPRADPTPLQPDPVASGASGPLRPGDRSAGRARCRRGCGRRVPASSAKVPVLRRRVPGRWRASGAKHPGEPRREQRQPRAPVDPRAHCAASPAAGRHMAMISG